MIVPATKELLREYYGHDPVLTMRAYVYLEDGKPVAIAGFVRVRAKIMFAVSEAKPEFFKHNKRGVVQMARAMMKIVDENGWTLIAEPDKNLATAEGFLKHLGFTDNQDGSFIR